MFGNTPGLTPLESRKRLLILESDLNRAQLASHLEDLRGEARRLGARARSLGSLASATAVLVAGVVAWRRGRAASAPVKPSKLRALVDGAGLLTAFCLAFRAPGPNRDDKGAGDTRS